MPRFNAEKARAIGWSDERIQAYLASPEAVADSQRAMQRAQPDTAATSPAADPSGIDPKMVALVGGGAAATGLAASRIPAMSRTLSNEGNMIGSAARGVRTFFGRPARGAMPPDAGPAPTSTPQAGAPPTPPAAPPVPPNKVAVSGYVRSRPASKPAPKPARGARAPITVKRDDGTTVRASRDVKQRGVSSRQLAARAQQLANVKAGGSASAKPGQMDAGYRPLPQAEAPPPGHQVFRPGQPMPPEAAAQFRASLLKSLRGGGGNALMMLLQAAAMPQQMDDAQAQGQRIFAEQERSPSTRRTLLDMLAQPETY